MLLENKNSVHVFVEITYPIVSFRNIHTMCHVYLTPLATIILAISWLKTYWWRKQRPATSY